MKALFDRKKQESDPKRIWLKMTKDGKCIMREKKVNGYGAFCISPKNEAGQIGYLKKPLTQEKIDEFKSIFEEVLSGKGRMVTLVGEPGIGKTRTAQELATYAGMRGAQVLWGRSYESGGAPPYWPWSDPF